ncbi:MAG: acyl-CoA synthetase [Novosphingobium sp.]|nr:acyl-CoA synthetase [Novosphingobium sp.]
MHIRDWAEKTPDTIAIRTLGAGDTLTFAELEAGSNRGAHLLRQLGLERGDAFAVWSGNSTRYLEIVFTMQRAGLYMVPIASKLTAPEAAYIVNDAKARVLIVDATLGAAAEDMSREAAQLCPDVEHFFAMRGSLPGLRSWEAETAKLPGTPIADQSTGLAMVYSSGTTGKPKGVHRALPEAAFDDPDFYTLFHKQQFDPQPGTAFLATAPLYHTGPLAFVVSELKLGASIVVCEKFDAEQVLAAIETYQVQRGQFVPTMFTRMLKLPDEIRGKYDVSSIQLALHSAAPCPIQVKRMMIEWWGPVLFEIYGGTENVGSTMIDSHEWLKKPGSVGRLMQGSVHVCAEDGSELAPSETGLIYFEGNASFKYLGDEDKTRDSRHPFNENWATFGDIGRVDEDGYLFLSDRRAFMIICGGVNIYPQEAENLLVMHPQVTDVAVFGVPDPDMGEQVKAVVQPADGTMAGPELEAELITYCRDHLASLKCPKSIDFEADLPRDPTGKMMKRQLRERYLKSAQAAN